MPDRRLIDFIDRISALKIDGSRPCLITDFHIRSSYIDFIISLAMIIIADYRHAGMRAGVTLAYRTARPNMVIHDGHYRRGA